jgi:hypothetical protein
VFALQVGDQNNYIEKFMKFGNTIPHAVMMVNYSFMFWVETILIVISSGFVIVQLDIHLIAEILCIHYGWSNGILLYYLLEVQYNNFCMLPIRGILWKS